MPKDVAAAADDDVVDKDNDDEDGVVLMCEHERNNDKQDVCSQSNAFAMRQHTTTFSSLEAASMPDY